MTRTGRMAGLISVWLARLSLSGIFIYAGATKVRDPQAFAESIASFRLLPAMLIDPVALTLPVLEIVAGVLALTTGRGRRAGAFCLLALLLVFIPALAAALARGLSVDCGCFGTNNFDVLSPTKNLWLAIARDVVLGTVAGWLYISAPAEGFRDSEAKISGS